MRTVHRYVARLGPDLERLLDFSRVRAGPIDLQREDIDLSAIVASTLEEMRTVLEVSQCPTQVTLAPDLVGSWASLRVRQVIRNLVSNAAKYAAGAPIVIQTSGDDRSAVFTIRDHGPGIPPKDRELCSGGSSARRVITPGSASACGGASPRRGARRYHRAGQHPDAGTTFTVTLPRI